MAWQPDYATTSDARSYVTISEPDEDIYLALAITAASRTIDRHCNRQFGSTDSVESRVYEARWSRKYGRYKVEVDDIQTLTGLVVTVNSSTVSSSDYDLFPRNAALEGRPWEEIYLDTVTRPTKGTGPSTITVDATFGWSSVPDPIKQATLLQAARYFIDRSLPIGVAGNPEFGSEMRLSKQVHPSVDLVANIYRRNKPMVL